MNRLSIALWLIKVNTQITVFIVPFDYSGGNEEQSNMISIEAMVRILVRRGFRTKEEIVDEVKKVKFESNAILFFFYLLVFFKIHRYISPYFIYLENSFNSARPDV